MRICCAQISQVYEDIDTAFARAEEYLASADADMVILARDIAKQIESELEYPGQIKVSLIRESRATDVAK